MPRSVVRSGSYGVYTAHNEASLGEAHAQLSPSHADVSASGATEVTEVSMEQEADTSDSRGQAGLLLRGNMCMCEQGF